MENEIAAYVGVDWASAVHYAFALDADGAKLGHRGFAHSGEGLGELVDWIRQTAGAKDDRRDALVLAAALRTDRAAHRLLEPMHPSIIELREWSRMTEDLSTERNRLANRFRAQLWR